MSKYRVTYDVGPDETCWWEVEADNAQHAEAAGALKFHNDAVWSSKYPGKIPRATVELVREQPRHGDTV